MKKKTGSTAMFMTYGKYLERYPQGRKIANAQADEYGYCIINNSDNTNICWLSIASFNLINNGFKTVSATGKKAPKKNVLRGKGKKK